MAPGDQAGGSVLDRCEERLSMDVARIEAGWER